MLCLIYFSFAYIHQMIAVRVILRISAQAQRQIETKISDRSGRIFQKRESRAGESLLTEQRRFFKTEPAEKRKNFGTVDKHCLLFFRRRRVPLAESGRNPCRANRCCTARPAAVIRALLSFMNFSGTAFKMKALRPVPLFFAPALQHLFTIHVPSMQTPVSEGKARHFFAASFTQRSALRLRG